MRFGLGCALLSFSVVALADKPITITFVHTNDLHAHGDATVIRKVPYGGYARQAGLIKQIRASEKNVLVLNAGDTFQGTLYFNVYEGLADISVLNLMGYDAATLGNHEFDRGPATLAAFLKHAAFPIVSSNIDFSKEPALAGLLAPSTILTVDGQKVGVVGATTEDTPNISSPGPTVSFRNTLASVQSEVDKLTKAGVNKIVVLTHIGYGEDKQLASKLHDVDLIVGGHSHTPLGTPELDGWPKSGGPYPTIVKDSTGQDVYVVQGWEWGKVVGKIKLSFDGKGKVRRLEEAKAIVMDEKVPEDPVVAAVMDAYRKPILSVQNQQIGDALEPIGRETNAQGTNPLGCLIADGMLEATKKAGAVVAFVNQGGVRANMEAGKITYGVAIGIQPFNNTLVVMDLTGAEIQKGLEQAAARGGLIPSAGSSYRRQGERVSEILIAGKPLDTSATYRIATLNFLAGGGDGVVAWKEAKGYRLDTGILDVDTLIEAIRRSTPLKAIRDVRIRQ